MLKKTLALIGLTLSFGANAALVDAINALNPGDQYRVLFVTSTTTDATSSDIATYNTMANDAGESGSITSGLGLTWRAVASTATVDACTNTATCAPSDAPVFIYNTEGTLLAESYNELWDGSLSAPVGSDENGDLITQFVWTGTGMDGRADVGFYLGGSFFAGYGYSAVSDGFWIDFGSAPPDEYEYHLYGLSSVATVVPLPAAGYLFITALAGLIGTKRFARRRHTC